MRWWPGARHLEKGKDRESVLAEPLRPRVGLGVVEGRVPTTDVDVPICEEQHSQRVHLGGIPDKNATVGLDGHEVCQPSAP